MAGIFDFDDLEDQAPPQARQVACYTKAQTLLAEEDDAAIGDIARHGLCAPTYVDAEFEEQSAEIHGQKAVEVQEAVPNSNTFQTGALNGSIGLALYRCWVDDKVNDQVEAVEPEVVDLEPEVVDPALPRERVACVESRVVASELDEVSHPELAPHVKEDAPPRWVTLMSQKQQASDAVIVPTDDQERGPKSHQKSFRERLREAMLEPEDETSFSDDGVDAVQGRSFDTHTVLFSIISDVLPMHVGKDGILPLDVIELWTQWGITYASRLRFEAPKGWPTKWLNIREDALPKPPAITRLDGKASILQAVGQALVQRDACAHTLADWQGQQRRQVAQKVTSKPDAQQEKNVLFQREQADIHFASMRGGFV